jgi:tetraacyldisaccharide 4'-kinase
MSAEAWLNRVWYGRASPPLWLVPLSLVYRAVSGARRLAYAKGLRSTVRLACPVIVVGNLTVGGTGKTPLVCWLAARLSGHGFAPGVVTRGYGGSARAPRLIDSSDDPNVVGDEPILLARRTGVPVAVGRDRPAAAQLLIDAGCNVIVSDDGLQHYALARDGEIVVVDGERGFGNGRFLPAGPLREGRARLSTADAIVVNGGHAPPAGVFRMRLEADEAVALSGGGRRPLESFAGEQVHAVAGIGHPERFFDMLRGRGIDVTAHALADHARIAERELRFGDGRPVLMTEKDAVKCTGAADPRLWYVPVDACFEGAESNKLLAIVMERMAERGRPPSRGSVHG